MSKWEVRKVERRDEKRRHGKGRKVESKREKKNRMDGKENITVPNGTEKNGMKNTV